MHYNGGEEVEMGIIMVERKIFCISIITVERRWRRLRSTSSWQKIFLPACLTQHLPQLTYMMVGWCYYRNIFFTLPV